MRARPFLLGLATATCVACGPTPQDHGTVTDASSSGDPDAPLAIDADEPTVDATCGAQSEDIALVNLGDPPDMLIVLDRSGSMTGPIPTFPPNFTPKWNIMRDAVKAVVMATENNIRYGLAEFPTDDNCGVTSPVKVPIDLGQYPEVNTYFNNRSANGNTPADAALRAALAHYQSIPVNPEGRYVLFATDGEPNCTTPEADAGPRTVAAIQALRQAGIKTYVLGFGGGFTTGTVLNDAALAGGVPRPGGPPHYYAANNAAELQAVLQQIAGGVIVPSCSYHLQSLPPVPDDVTVTLNGQPVPRSTLHTNGWDYHPDAQTITFFGSYCQQIMSGAIGNVAFAYGCPGPVID